ncbi:MAG: lipid-A-disaccharide synthase [Bacteroidales bacterium]
MKYYIIAGEASGDLHGSNLMKAIRERDPLAEFRCWGGDLMAEQGAELVKHYKDLAFMGFIEVALHLKTILRNMKTCKQDILQYNPDVIILIDYPGFNLRIAEFSHKQGFKVVYYISPQVWAWKKSRVYTIRKVVDKMLVILPFEKEFYARYDYPVDFVGHPLLDVIDNEHKRLISGTEKPIIALLPGSRKQEIESMLPVMLSIIPSFPGYTFVIAGAPGIDKEYYYNFLEKREVEITFGNTYKLLGQACAAVVTSGTASLEAALFKVPQVICYKGSPISYSIAKRIVRIKYIGLPNLIMDKEIVTELIQNDLTTEKLTTQLSLIVGDADRINKITSEYELLARLLGGKGASDRAANKIIDFLNTLPA